LDVSVIRLVVLCLATVCCVCLLGLVVVAASGHEPPAALASVASTAAGALVGILVLPRDERPH